MVDRRSATIIIVTENPNFNPTIQIIQLKV